MREREREAQRRGARPSKLLPRRSLPRILALQRSAGNRAVSVDARAPGAARRAAPSQAAEAERARVPWR